MEAGWSLGGGEWRLHGTGWRNLGDGWVEAEWRWEDAGWDWVEVGRCWVEVGGSGWRWSCCLLIIYCLYPVVVEGKWKRNCGECGGQVNGMWWWW